MEEIVISRVENISENHQKRNENHQNRSENHQKRNENHQKGSVKIHRPKRKMQEETRLELNKTIEKSKAPLIIRWISVEDRWEDMLSYFYFFLIIIQNDPIIILSIFLNKRIKCLR